MKEPISALKQSAGWGRTGEKERSAGNGMVKSNSRREVVAILPVVPDTK